MNTLVINQTHVFISFIFIGIIISFIFDLFRLIRISYKFSNISVILQDTLFWLLSGIIIIYSILILNSGEIRVYLFFSMFLGIVIYTCFISTYIIKIGNKILHIFNIFVKALYSMINICFNICINIQRKFIYSIKNFSKKILRIERRIL